MLPWCCVTKQWLLMILSSSHNEGFLHIFVGPSEKHSLFRSRFAELNLCLSLLCVWLAAFTALHHLEPP